MTHAPTEIAAMIERLDTIYKDDHERGCPMRCSACECGFEAAVDATAKDAAAMLRDVAAERDEWRDRHKSLGNAALLQIGESAKLRGKAEAEADRLAAMVEKLRGYAVHDDDCDSNRWRWAGDCTCGLSAILKESENG